jgi:sugar-specific transcriptional regulator TrmB
METEEEIIQVLVTIGLTKNQAKVYLTLARRQKEKINQISKLANVDRSNTYQAITQLQQKKLVQKILGKPSYFEALPLKEGIHLLLRQQEDECRKTREEAEKLVKKLNSLRKTCATDQNEVRVEISTKEKVIKTVNQMYPVVEENVDLLFNKKRFYEIIPDVAEDHVKCAERGVKVRMIVEKIDPDILQKPLLALMAQPNIEIRYINFQPKSDLFVMDKRYASISLVPGSGVEESTDLYSYNEGFIEIVENHFEKIWSQAHQFRFTQKKQLIERKIHN